MRAIRPVSETQVLECFWRGESVKSSRWSAAEVEERRRTWHQRVGLFAGFPDDVAWELVALSRDELLAVLYINWHWWLKVSNGTRLATVAADVQGRDEGDRAVAAAAARNAELIAVTDPERSKLVLLEGHVRLTAYGAFPELLPPELNVYLGVSPRIEEWSQW
jgi:hypothetical protein